MSVSVEIRANHFPGMGGRFMAADRDIRTKWSLDVYAASISHTPVDTGGLVNNVSTGVGEVHWHQNYAAHQNNGTVHIHPKLFANQGVEIATPEAISAYRQLGGRLV